MFVPSALPTDIRGDADVTQIDAAMQRQGDLVGFGSSHPQGGAVRGDDPRISVVDDEFRVHGFDDLFVADGSVFPHSVGVNPMLSIMAAADYATRSIAGVRPAAEIEEGPAHRARQHAAQDGARGASA